MNQKKELLLNQAYQEFIDIGLNIKPIMDELDHLIDLNIMGFGTTEDERIFSRKDFIDLIKRQEEQAIGLKIQHHIEPVHRRVLEGENSAIYVDDLILRITAGSDQVEMKMRFSMVLEYQESRWIVVHWHGSKPEEVKSEEDTWGVENWKQKAEELEKLVAEKTSDLVKKNRDLEIEAALERVRSRSMAMYHSQELEEVVGVTFNQLQSLNLPVDGCQLITFEDQSRDFHFWSATPDMTYPVQINIPYFDNPVFIRFWEAKDGGASFTSFNLTREETLDFYNHVYHHTDLGRTVTKERWKKIQSIEHGFRTSWGIQKNTGLFIFNFDDHIFTPEENSIIDRFAKVFEQAYTRFLDLKKAEAQAREAQIEAALERVRARAMAMHDSSEMLEVADVLFQQIRSLGGELWACGVVICNGDQKDDEVWFANEKGVLPPIAMPHTEEPTHQRMYDGWKNKLDLFTHSAEGEELRKHYEYMLSVDSAKPLFEKIQASGMSFPNWQKWHAAYFSRGYLLIITLEPYEDVSIFTRFAKVFDQAYTRFLDLQKSEAQARESEIQLALERVRARTMAMQHSDELTEASKVLDQQVRALGIDTWGCAFHIYADDPEGDYEWFSSKAGTLPFYKTPRENFFLKFYEKGKAGETFHVEEFLGEACKAHYEYIMTIPVMGDALREVVASGGSLPESQYDHIAFFKHGFLLFITYQPVPEAHDIFLRFAKVFEQTYTRFLDLKKAEAQAREAQIEVALERIRSRAMAMHDPEELTEVLALMFDQLSQLGVDALWTHLTLIDLEKNIFTYRMTSRDGKPVHAEQVVQLDAMDSWSHTVETFKSQNPETVTQIHFLPEVLPRVWELFDGIFSSLPKESKMSPEDFPNGIHTTEANCKFGYLGINQRRKATDEEKKILGRFGSEFGRLYQRYLDIEKAQKQAREA
ncbi:MAG: nuclear transport factor 2 family protein, partial [Cyclobacteriaceae bacterium]|nr:nuclear transport factor 2 family protein [Cyclobacteriaceae bacterium]